MKNIKKGFTLVELLAVVVIIAVILIIATNVISDRMKRADRESYKISANSYVKAVNNAASISRVDANKLDFGIYSVDDLSDYDVQITGTKPVSGSLYISNYKVISGCLIYDQYSVVISDGVAGDVDSSKVCPENENFNTVFAYTGSAQEFKVPATGTYKIQLWGAEGGDGRKDSKISGTPGKGGYAEGLIELTKGETLYVYVGQHGQDGVKNDNTSISFNGGGYGTSDGENGGDYEAAGAGGGATDVRLVSGSWNSIDSLVSRIMVAGGGGGNTWTFTAGCGGGISGCDGNNATNAPGATQTTGYAFGIGKNGEGRGDSDGVAGGGGGYWGGISINSINGETASGGSGYISGHTGCVAIASSSDTSAKDGCSNETTDRECSIHYSNRVFTNTVLTAGSESMPTHDGSSTMTGNSGDGYAKISYIMNE